MPANSSLVKLGARLNRLTHRLSGVTGGK